MDLNSFIFSPLIRPQHTFLLISIILVLSLSARATINAYYCEWFYYNSARSTTLCPVGRLARWWKHTHEASNESWNNHHSSVLSSRFVVKSSVCVALENPASIYTRPNAKNRREWMGNLQNRREREQQQHTVWGWDSSSSFVSLEQNKTQQHRWCKVERNVHLMILFVVNKHNDCRYSEMRLCYSAHVDAIGIVVTHIFSNIAHMSLFWFKLRSERRERDPVRPQPAHTTFMVQFEINN